MRVRYATYVDHVYPTKTYSEPITAHSTSLIMASITPTKQR
jgi:hypothetical protein